MLKNKIKKRIFLILSSLIIVLIIYLFPTKENNPKINDKVYNDEQGIIYLIDNNAFVSRVDVLFKEKDLENKVKEIIDYLTIDNPKTNYIKEGFKPIIPAKTKLLSISIDKDLVKLNFSREILNVKADEEYKLISSIIYSLTSLDEINKISLYIEGNILTKMPHSKESLPSTLNRFFGINQIYDLTNIKGSSNTTVYYLSKYKDYYYYVPITLINNKEKEKIDVIIKELSSKSVYQTSLISYLKTSKEIDYSLKKEQMIINFNQNLFDDLNNDNLLEKVIYSINLSIKDNYELEKVTYLINDMKYKDFYI